MWYCCCILWRQVDNEIAAAFKDLLTKQGMTFRLGTKVTTSSVSDDGVTLTVEPSKGGAAESIQADVVRPPHISTCLVVKSYRRSRWLSSSARN